MKKLWRVDVEFRTTVVAIGDNAAEAEQHVKVDADEIWYDNHYMNANYFASSIQKDEDLPADWWDQNPYGDDSGEICEEIMTVIHEANKKKEAEVYRDKFQLKFNF